MNVSILYAGSQSEVTIQRSLPPDIQVLQTSAFDTFAESPSVHAMADVIIIDMLKSHGRAEHVYLVKKIQNITKLPILLATKHDEDPRYRESMVNAGVDHCIVAPFMDDELRLRLEKLVPKKHSLRFVGTDIVADTVHMDIEDHAVFKENVVIHLTKTEYKILFHLLLHKNTLVTSEELAASLNDGTGASASAVNVHILNIRKKVGDAGLIKTVPNCGFTVVSPFI